MIRGVRIARCAWKTPIRLPPVVELRREAYLKRRTGKQLAALCEAVVRKRGSDIGDAVAALLDVWRRLVCCGVRIELFLGGIGPAGHIAFNEPGASFEEGFHVTALAESTRVDAKARFVPDQPPRRAVRFGVRLGTRSARAHQPSETR